MSRPAVYVITVQGALNEDWAVWFDGMAITRAQDADGNAVTMLECLVEDQSALHAILNKIRDVNLILVSLVQPKGGHHG